MTLGNLDVAGARIAREHKIIYRKTTGLCTEVSHNNVATVTEQRPGSKLSIGESENENEASRLHTATWLTEEIEQHSTRMD